MPSPARGTLPHGPYRVQYWREPLPELEMRERSPDDWEKLINGPGFLILELFKPASA